MIKYALLLDNIQKKYDTWIKSRISGDVVSSYLLILVMSSNTEVKLIDVQKPLMSYISKIVKYEVTLKDRRGLSISTITSG